MKLKGLGVLTINRYEKKLIFFTFLLFLHNNIFAKTQGEIIRDGIVQTGIATVATIGAGRKVAQDGVAQTVPTITVGAAIEVAKTTNKGKVKVAISNLVKKIKNMHTVEKVLSTKKYKILKNIKYMKLQKASKYEIKSLEKQLKLIDTGLSKIKKAKSLLTKEGIKFVKPNLKYAKKLKILGQIGDGLTIAINVDELRRAYAKNNGLRIQHKWAELVTNGAVIAAGTIAGAGAVVTIPAAMAVGIGAAFNDASEKIVKEEVKTAKNKIFQLNESLSNEALTESMINSMQKIAKEPLSYTKDAIKEKLRKAFNNDIKQMLKTVNNEIDKINKRRMYVPFKGRLVRNQGDALLYDWLKNKKNILTNIQMYSLFGNSKDNSEIAQFVKHYTDDFADNYTNYQINYLSKNDIGTIINSLSQPQATVPKAQKPKQVLTAHLKKQKAKKLLEENKKLSKEYGELYKKAKLYPNDKKLQSQLAQKDKELRANASAFIALRGEIQKNDPSYKAFVDGPLTVQKRVDKEPQPIAVEQPKEPKVTTEKVKEEPITLADNKVEELPKAKTATNPNIDANKNKLDIIKEKDAKLKVSIREKDRLDRVIEKKRERLNQLREQQNNENRYTYTGQQGKKRVKKINISKLKYLVRARHFIQRRSNIPFSKWSKEDKVALGILSTNLGVRYGSNIISRAIYLKAMLNRGKFAFLRDKYATTYTYQNINKKRATPNPNYNMYDLQAKNLLREINTLSDKSNQLNNHIRVAQSSLIQLQNSLGDTVDDYLNDNKEELSISATPVVTEKDWRGNFTFAAEKHDGTTIYTGGDWGTTEEFLQWGPSDLFSFDSSNPDIVNGGHFEHGANTATDNTKQFDVIASGTNTNIKSLNISQNVGNGNTLSFKEIGHYTYTVWGEWAQTGGLKTDINNGTGLDLAALHNNWIVGDVTKELPQQGSATYTGRVDGYTTWSSDNKKIHGSMSMTVDFTNTAVVAGTLNLLKPDNSTFATATMDNMQINRNSRAFSGRLIGSNLAPLQSHVDQGGTSYNNQINGSFYGPSAEEVGGTWKVQTASSGNAFGTFAGKR